MTEEELIRKQNELFRLLHRIADDMSGTKRLEPGTNKKVANLSFEISMENMKRQAA